MFGTKLLGLVLSSVMFFTPINKDLDVDYSFPRYIGVSVTWQISYTIDDLGPLTPSNSAHDYIINYHVNFYCNHACTLNGIPSNDPGDYALTQERIFTVRTSNKTPEAMISYMSGIATGGSSGLRQHEFQSASELFGIEVSLHFAHGDTTTTVYFCPIADIDVLRDIDYKVDEFSNLYFLQNFLMNKDVPSTDIQTVTNYLNNGDYSSAVNYIYNYYTTNSVSTNVNNETVVNNYSTKETSLNTYYNTENNFTNQVETDFQNQEQQLPDLNDSIQDMQSTSFLSSANWVTQQFNRMTQNTVFGSFLIFSLFTGFIMALIGRFKR